MECSRPFGAQLAGARCRSYASYSFPLIRLFRSYSIPQIFPFTFSSSLPLVCSSRQVVSFCYPFVRNYISSSIFRSFSIRQGVSSVIVVTFWTVGFSEVEGNLILLTLILTEILFNQLLNSPNSLNLGPLPTYFDSFSLF